MEAKDIINVNFGKRIASLRKEKGLSQESLAYNCNLNRTYIGAVERGEKSPTIVTITKIANGLEISLVELFQY